MIDAVQKTILRYFNTTQQIQFIVDYANITEPVEEYGTVGLVSLIPVNGHQKHYYYDPVTDTYVDEVVEDLKALISVSVYGGDSYTNAMRVRSSLLHKEASYNFYFEGLGIAQVSGIRRIPEMRETKFVQRATFEFQVFVRSSDIIQTEWFNKVSVEEKLYDPAGKLIRQEIDIYALDKQSK